MQSSSSIGKLGNKARRLIMAGLIAASAIGGLNTNLEASSRDRGDDQRPRRGQSLEDVLPAGSIKATDWVVDQTGRRPRSSQRQEMAEMLEGAINTIINKYIDLRAKEIHKKDRSQNIGEIKDRLRAFQTNFAERNLARDPQLKAKYDALDPLGKKIALGFATGVINTESLTWVISSSRSLIAANEGAFTEYAIKSGLGDITKEITEALDKQKQRTFGGHGHLSPDTLTGNDGDRRPSSEGLGTQPQLSQIFDVDLGMTDAEVSQIREISEQILPRLRDSKGQPYANNAEAMGALREVVYNKLGADAPMTEMLKGLAASGQDTEQKQKRVSFANRMAFALAGKAGIIPDNPLFAKIRKTFTQKNPTWAAITPLLGGRKPIPPTIDNTDPRLQF
jgi:hypothetical protein